MQEQFSLIETEESYKLDGIEESVKRFVRKKYPHAVAEEDYEDYLQFLEDEYNLELIYRLEIILENLKKKAETKKDGLTLAYSCDRIESRGENG